MNRDRPVRIANCCGFFGDRLSAAHARWSRAAHRRVDRRLAGRADDADPAESSGPQQRAGTPATFLTQMEQVLGTCAERGITVVSNAGGLNPAGLRREGSRIADRLGLRVSVAHVDGDDLMPRHRRPAAALAHLDTGEPLTADADVSANAYLGGWGIAAALDAGADVVICPRVTDASLVVGPAAWWWDWARDDWDRAGRRRCRRAHHRMRRAGDRRQLQLLRPRSPTALRPPGFPIAEIDADGRPSSPSIPAPVVWSRRHRDRAVALRDRRRRTTSTPTSSPLRHDPARRGGPGPGARQRRAGRRRRHRRPRSCINFDGGYRNRMTFVLTGLDQRGKGRVGRAALFDRLGGADRFDEVDVALRRGTVRRRRPGGVSRAGCTSP